MFLPLFPVQPRTLVLDFSTQCFQETIGSVRWRSKCQSSIRSDVGGFDIGKQLSVHACQGHTRCLRSPALS